MKNAPSLLVPLALLAVSLLAKADTASPMMLTQRMEEFRECFVKNLNCTAIREGFKQTALSSNIPGMNVEQQADSGMEWARGWFERCPEARVPLSKIKTNTQIIVHNFLLDECAAKEYSSLAQDSSAKAVSPLDKIIIELSYASYFRQTQYQLGHITEAEYDNSITQQKSLDDALTSASKMLDAQAKQIQQLQQQLADIQSKDHQACRQIQAMAALNGGVPPNC